MSWDGTSYFHHFSTCKMGTILALKIIEQPKRTMGIESTLKSPFGVSFHSVWDSKE